MNSIAVSVVSYYSEAEGLTETVASLARAAAQAGARVSLTLTDNSEQSKDTERLARLISQWIAQNSLHGLSQINFLQTGQNLGYGQANNLALARCKQAFVLVLNPDVSLNADLLEQALRHLTDNPDTSLLTPRALGPMGNDLHLNHGHPSVLALLGRAVPALAKLAPVQRSMAHYELRDLAVDSPHQQTRCASGCFMLMRASAWRAIVGFSTYFFMYFEYYDLSLRILEHGNIAYVPTARLVHLGGQASQKGSRHQLMFAKSAWRFFRRHGLRWV